MLTTLFVLLKTIFPLLQVPCYCIFPSLSTITITLFLAMNRFVDHSVPYCNSQKREYPSFLDKPTYVNPHQLTHIHYSLVKS